MVPTRTTFPVRGAATPRTTLANDDPCSSPPRVLQLGSREFNRMSSTLIWLQRMEWNMKPSKRGRVRDAPTECSSRWERAVKHLPKTIHPQANKKGLHRGSYPTFPLAAREGEIVHQRRRDGRNAPRLVTEETRQGRFGMKTSAVFRPPPPGLDQGRGINPRSLVPSDSTLPKSQHRWMCRKSPGHVWGKTPP